MSIDDRDLELERHNLDNGLRVVLHPDRRLPLVAVNLWYHVGSKDERPGRTGFAHLFEHMLFQGSQHVDTNGHFRHILEVGGVANGSTWYDRTNYFETLPAHYLDLALWLESDRMGFLLPAMTREKLDKQREVVINERRQRIDNQPYGRAFERVHELLYPPEFPYHWPVIGYMEDIEAATLEDVQAFFRTHYLPNNAVLTVAGDFRNERALESIERYFGPIPGGDDPPRPQWTLPPLDGGAREVLEDEVRLPRIYLACRAPRFGEKGWYAADLLSNVWSAGKASRFYQELIYRRQIAQEVAAWITPTERVATLCLLATARPGVSAEELEAAVLEGLERCRSEAVTEEEMERAKNKALTDHFSDLQRLERRADLLGHCTTFFDDPGLLSRRLELYAEITTRDVLAYARRFTAPEERVTVLVVPARQR